MTERLTIAHAADGAVAYAIPLPPERLPAVPPEALRQAWSLARAGATAQRHGPPRHLVFARDGAPPLKLEIADPDARAWAAALDTAIGLDRLGGLALCLRLLALIELLTRARWADRLIDLEGGEAELDRHLLAAAATLPLDAAARFDENTVRRALPRSPVAGAEA